jgi:hypothetical protein
MQKPPIKQSADIERRKIASREELNRFLAKLAKLQPRDKEEEEEEREQAIRSSLGRIKRRELQRLMGRAFADALKSPSQKLGTAKPPLDGRAPTKKTEPEAEGKKRRGSAKKQSRRRRRGAGRSRET